jgi:MFS-type transporter involved in bile tolerance (Atg22 family)
MPLSSFSYESIASQVMAIPDFVSAILVPFAGTFVDKLGRRVKVLFVCGMLMTVFHYVMAYATAATLPSPIPLLVLLGLSYSLLLTFWPCIPIVVPEKTLATAL